LVSSRVEAIGPLLEDEQNAALLAAWVEEYDVADVRQLMQRVLHAGFPVRLRFSGEGTG
jgi:hypothetical protein